MKKMYIQPQTSDVLFMPDSLVMLLGSESGPEPTTAPERQAEGGEFLPL